MTDAMSSLIDGIIYAVKTLINKAEYDQTVSGHVLYSLGNQRHVVRVNGEDYIVKSNGLFHAFDSVEVTKPKNKWRNAYISYPNTISITSEELSAEAEVIRQEAEETRIANELERVTNEETRQATYKEMLVKSEEYDAAEAERSASCATAIQKVKDAQSSIESSYTAIQEDYSTLSQDMSTSIKDCDEIIERCEIATQKCEEIVDNGYVTHEELEEELANIDFSGLCKLVQKDGKVYLEVI